MTAELWYSFFVIVFLVFIFILYRKKEIRFFWYFVFGSLFGFMFDLFSYTFGYYSYPDFYLLTVFGLPFSMTLAEGFCVATMIFFFEEYLWPLIKK